MQARQPFIGTFYLGDKTEAFVCSLKGYGNVSSLLLDLDVDKIYCRILKAWMTAKQQPTKAIRRKASIAKRNCI